MAKIYTRITDLIGGTPLLELVNLEKTQGLQATLLAKLSRASPAILQAYSEPVELRMQFGSPCPSATENSFMSPASSFMP